MLDEHRYEALMYPRGVDPFKKQFAHLEEKLNPIQQRSSFSREHVPAPNAFQANDVEEMAVGTRHRDFRTNMAEKGDALPISSGIATTRKKSRETTKLSVAGTSHTKMKKLGKNQQGPTATTKQNKGRDKTSHKATRQNKSRETTFQLRDEDEDVDDCGEGNILDQFSQPREEDRRTNAVEKELAQIEPTGNSNMEAPPPNKKVRGPTLMAKLWGQPEGQPKVKILTNALSQPIGRTKTTFVEFLGSVARTGKFAPIDYKAWTHVPIDNKIHMLKLVKEKFELPPGMQYWILKALGRRWKSWKGRLKRRYYKENIPMEDTRVVEAQWTKLTAYWATEEAKRIAKDNKRNRLKKTLDHRTGKKSFAQVHDDLMIEEKDLGPPTRVRLFKACFLDKNKTAKSSAVATVVAAMDEKTSQLPADFHDEIGPDDVFAQVIGKDGNGRVRMMGGGICPSDIWGIFPSRGASFQLAMEYKSALEQQAEINKKLMDDLADLRSLIMSQKGTSSARSASSVQQRVETSLPLKVNNSVAMKSCYDASKTVAEGILKSVDPTRVLGGGQVLGKGWCLILVEVPVDPLEGLVRPFGWFETIGDVIGVQVPWPQRLVCNTQQSDDADEAEEGR